MTKLTWLIITAVAALAFTPTANALSGDTSVGQSWGPYGAPVSQEPGSCDSNYSGPCVPVASDVDCEGGSGNGPAYVAGPVQVVGSDIYGLDRDGNGVGCE
jgi:hypothetical protein